jgi:uncharacterized protein (TIGR02466 family)
MVTMPKPRFEDAGVLRMFPAFVWKARLAAAEHAAIDAAVERTLGEAGAPVADLRPGDSWQSDHGLHERPDLAALMDAIRAAAETVLDHLRVVHAGIRITGCWANINAPGARHPLHSHPNNYLSGVYYVRTYDGADTINFHDSRPQAGVIRPPVRELTAENADQVVVKVEDGTLLLFPAWLQHSVDPNRSGRVRISLGFNVMFANYAESMSPPTWEPGLRRSR